CFSSLVTCMAATPSPSQLAADTPLEPIRSYRAPQGRTDSGSQREPIADREAAAGAFSGRKLEHRLRAAARSRAPGLDAVCDAEHDEAPVEENGVDREAHEPGVDRRGRPKQQALPRPQPVTAKQAPQAGQRSVCEGQPFADDASVGPPEGELLSA